jgi:DNA-binding NarL/FixJ family response regulator
MTGKSRIVLADDHPIVLAGLRSLIEPEGDLEVVGTASTGLEALKLVRDVDPDLAVVDISMPGLTGIGLLHRLADQGLSARVLILSLHEDRAHVNHALQAGARGYMLKRTASESAIAAIRAVLTGGIYIDPAIAGHALNPKSATAWQPTSKMAASNLTDREASVLKFAAMGFSNKEIAHRLDVGVKSVETYKARGSEKLGLRSRVELIRYGLTQGWLANV